ncbi:hypothetical protein [Fulvivirga imtechensis]|uniref:hypothetical protein n=1 Tax=Fulvivirga imtechensis TaxID=881893 RepID=UPI0012FCBBDA|nr:hypothetical protein [Fulvivirga imtechensis]
MRLALSRHSSDDEFALCFRHCPPLAEVVERGAERKALSVNPPLYLLPGEDWYARV